MESVFTMPESFVHANLMGPNVLLLEKELCADKLPQSPTARICDLGCGMGLSSLALAAQTKGIVYAIDSWNETSDNQARFDLFPQADHIVAVKASAPDLPFCKGHFDTLVCLGSYGYFGRTVGVVDKVASYVKTGGKLLLAIPGTKRTPTDADMRVYGKSWTSEQMAFLPTADFWHDLFAQSEAIRIESIHQMACHEQAWHDWISCDNPYAKNDRAACDAGAIDLMCTIGIELTVL